jgi:hypothetical protein
VRYGIDAEHLTVWIEPFDRGVDVRSGVLCRRHADAMVVPIGWLLDDRREPVPRLFRAPAPVHVERPRRQRHAHTRDDTEQLELAPVADEPAEIDEPDTAGVTDAAVAPAADLDALPPAEPWRPVFDQTDDLGGLLAAKGPLLSRAFRGRERPRR